MWLISSFLHSVPQNSFAFLFFSFLFFPFLFFFFFFLHLAVSVICELAITDTSWEFAFYQPKVMSAISIYLYISDV